MRRFLLVLTLVSGTPELTLAQNEQANLPPRISILYPRNQDTFSSECIKIKADATDPDGSIVQVQFFSGTNLIGTVSNPPFNIVWQADCGVFTLTAIATDNMGMRAESPPVLLEGCFLWPPEPVVEMVQPRNGTLFAAPATFVFSAELLTSLCDVGPVEFFIDGRSVGTADPFPDSEGRLMATTPLHSITVSNIVEGEHKLSVRYYGYNGDLCTCDRLTNTIRVVKLGVQSPRLTSERLFQFDVLTSFPNVETIIQASPNLQDWTPIETNQPPTNTFVFTETSPATNAHRFYRVVLPSQQP